LPEGAPASRTSAASPSAAQSWPPRNEPVRRSSAAVKWPSGRPRPRSIPERSFPPAETLLVNRKWEACSMGVVSKKLASPFRKPSRQLVTVRRQAAGLAPAPKDVHSMDDLIRSGHDPLHAAYIAAQNFTSFIAEAVSQFPELDPYCRIVGPAEEEYMPDGPPF